jgi:predicted regulator of Ras-like GTPase activity (Roadblock/LC7/MglB family)
VYYLKLERVLTKLKFDDSVSGYALVTNQGHPFLSFSLPDDVLPQIRATLKIHVNDLKLMNILTSQGSVILARVDPKWVLVVLFTPELPLGGALSRTQAVVDLLVQVDLPPPPKFAPEPEIEVVIEEPIIADEIEEVLPEEEDESLPSEVEVFHGCVALRGKRYNEAMTLDSKLNLAMKRAYSNLGVDILLVIDEKMTVYKIADHLAKPVEQVLEAVTWCVNEGITDVECPDEQEPGQKEIVEMPLFEGNIKKAKKQHRAVLELCDGTRSLHQIATVLGIQYFAALQCTIPYRGKTLKFIRTDKITRG